jgi:hypothetical protein
MTHDRWTLLVALALATGCPDDGDVTGDGTSTGSSSEETTTTEESTSTSGVDSTTMEPVVLCDNGVLDPGEICDGNMFQDADSCITQGFAGGDLVCLDDCAGFSTSECLDSICGDGLVEGREECEGNDLAETTCLDLEFDDGVLACAKDCVFDTTGCITFACGDGELNDKREECDGEEIDPKASCEAGGFGAGTVGCTKTCTIDYTGCCGDGLIGGDELCDGFDVGLEDCTTVEGDFVGGFLACVPTCDAFDVSGCNMCGNNVIDDPEVCDGTELGTSTCVDLGYDGGEIACSFDCTYDVTNCVGGGTSSGSSTTAAE